MSSESQRIEQSRSEDCIAPLRKTQRYSSVTTFGRFVLQKLKKKENWVSEWSLASPFSVRASNFDDHRVVLISTWDVEVWAGKSHPSCERIILRKINQLLSKRLQLFNSISSNPWWLHHHHHPHKVIRPEGRHSVYLDVKV